MSGGAGEPQSRRSAFVTGGGSGIGRAVALELAVSGHGVGVFDVDADDAARTVELIAERNAPRALALQGDVASADQVVGGVEQTVDALGPLAGAVANAGIWAAGDALKVTHETWDRAMAVNVTGAFNTARAALTAMLRQERNGSLVAIASDVGVQASQNCAAYVTSKHAVVGLFRTLALDFGPRSIRSNVVCPGFVETPLADEVFREGSEATVAARRAEVPLGRFAVPIEIARVVDFLVSERAAFVNGAVLLCDGGASAGHFHGDDRRRAEQSSSRFTA